MREVLILIDAAGVDGRGFFFLAVGNFDRKFADRVDPDKLLCNSIMEKGVIPVRGNFFRRISAKTPGGHRQRSEPQL